MPSGLDIDYKRQLKGSVAPYTDHLLIHTGTADWPSRIEDDARFPLAAELKTALKKEIVKSLPARPANVLVSNSSIASEEEVVVSLMKGGLHIGLKEGQNVQELVDAILSPVPMGEMSAESLKSMIAGKFVSSEISEVTIFICGHGGRDERCGIMGPLLQDEFADTLSRGNVSVERTPIILSKRSPAADARIGLVSHIGGHAFAGNVILYIPKTAKYTSHPLAGLGVWYGRVEPRHVQGIMEQTIRDGLIIEELLRGVV